MLEECRVLGQVSDLGFCQDGIGGNINTINNGGAPRGREKADEYLHACGLACAVGPQKAEYLPLPHFKGHVLQSRKAIEILAQAHRFQLGLGYNSSATVLHQ